MRNRSLALCLSVALSWAAPAHANRLIEGNVQARVADSALSVTPGQDWNRLSARPGRSTELWTLDGHALNSLTFYGGIQDDRPIFREVNRRAQPLPRFSATMLVADIPTLLENSYRVGRSISLFTVDQAEPVTFAGQRGIRFRYNFVGPDEVRRRGEAHGTIVDGQLYLITFEAPAIHYFEAGIAASQQIVQSAMFNAPQRSRPQRRH